MLDHHLRSLEMNLSSGIRGTGWEVSDLVHTTRGVREAPNLAPCKGATLPKSDREVAIQE